VSVVPVSIADPVIVIEVFSSHELFTILDIGVVLVHVPVAIAQLLPLHCASVIVYDNTSIFGSCNPVV